MGELVRMDERKRITLPSEAAALFPQGLVFVKKQKGKVVLEPVNDPFKDLKGLVRLKRPFLEIRRELERELESGRRKP